MSFGKLPIALSVIFVVFILALAGEYVYIIWRRRSFPHRSSPAPPISTGDQKPKFSIIDPATKELLYFFCLKPQTNEPPKINTDGSSPDDLVVDVFKLKEVSGLSRFLSTIKEEDKEELESTPDVDFSVKLPEGEDVVVVTIDRDEGNAKTVFSTPCDSPMFFTPVGSPSRDDR